MSGPKQQTLAVAAGASAGGGVVLGGSVGGGVQVVADPQGNVGVAFSFSAIFPETVIGYGAVAGGQVSVSNAHSISDLNG